MSGVLGSGLPHEQCCEFLLAGLPQDGLLVDVGCGDGRLLRLLADRGGRVAGVDVNPSHVAACQRAGWEVELRPAEQLPWRSGSVAGVVCSVVLPYTDERRCVLEWGRVLRPGGMVAASYHGLGYGLNYLRCSGNLRSRFYGLRMLANTACYSVTGWRLPGFLGDTLCQTAGRLRRHYRAAGLQLVEERIIGEYRGWPIFLCHRLVKAKSV